jgi:hypothetical protein
MNGTDGRITERVVRKSARRARDYQIAYSLIQKRQEQEENGEAVDQDIDNEYGITWETDETSVSYALIDKVVKQVRKKKTHRSPRDLDTAFINSL